MSNLLKTAGREIDMHEFGNRIDWEPAEAIFSLVRVAKVLSHGQEDLRALRQQEIDILDRAHLAPRWAQYFGRTAQTISQLLPVRKGDIGTNSSS